MGKSDLTKQRILEAAEQEFSEKGLYGARVDEIAAKGIKTDDVLSSLTLLELFGFIQSLPGGRYERLS